PGTPAHCALVPGLWPRSPSWFNGGRKPSTPSAYDRLPINYSLRSMVNFGPMGPWTFSFSRSPSFVRNAATPVICWPPEEAWPREPWEDCPPWVDWPPSLVVSFWVDERSWLERSWLERSWLEERSWP